MSSATQNMQPENKNFHKKLTKYQNGIIKIHRTACLLPYYMFAIECKKQQQISQSFLPNLSELDLLTILFKPKEIPTFPVLSMMVQESSFLISYFENNPSYFAQEIINSKNYLSILDYYHLMFQIIPSIYGYYHSFEHLKSASKFYQSIIDIISDNPQEYIRILQPFLNSPATYRYVEFVMTKFFKKVILSKSFNNFTDICFNDKNSYSYKDYLLDINKNTKKLLYYLTKGVSLLPDPILSIFRRIKEKYSDKWTIKNWYKLVFTIFISPHLTRWARSHFINNDENNVQKPQNSINSCSINIDPKARISSLPKSPIRLHPKSQISSLPKGKFFSNASNENHSKSRKQKIDLINDILSNILNDLFKRDLDFFIETLCTANSSYNPPLMYKCFGDYSLRYYMMTNDLIVLVNFLVSRNILPSFIKQDLFRAVPDDLKNGFFYLTVYQTVNSEKVTKIEMPIVFPNISIDEQIFRKIDQQGQFKSRLANLESLTYSDEKDVLTFALEKSANDPKFHEYVVMHVANKLSQSAELFEVFIEMQRLFNEVEKWSFLSSSCQNFLLLAYLWMLRRFPSLFEFLPNKVKLLNQLAIVEEKELIAKLENALNFSSDFDLYIQDLVSSRIQNEEENVDDDFPFISEPYSKSDPTATKYLNLIEKLECFNKTSHLPLFFLKALSTFSMIPFVCLPEKYVIFMKFLGIIDDFFPKDDNTLFLMLIKKISGSLLMKTFIEMSAVAIHNDVCFNFIPIIEVKRWQRFENLIYETVSDNDDMFQKILKCQMFFQEEFMSVKKNMEK